MLYVLRTLGASNLILALPLTRVAQICIMTASMVYAELQPFKIANSKLTIDFLNVVITFPSSTKKVLPNLNIRGLYVFENVLKDRKRHVCESECAL